MRSIDFEGGAAAPFPDGMFGQTDVAMDRDIHLAEAFFPELAEWGGVLSRLRMPTDLAIRIAIRARQEEGGDFASALLAAGFFEAGIIVQAIAAELGIKVATDIATQRLVLNDEQALALLRRDDARAAIRLIEPDGAVSLLITPRHLRLEAMRNWLSLRPTSAARLKLADPRLLRAAVLERVRPILTRTAVAGLSDRFPDMSARTVLTGWQGVVFGGVSIAVPVALILAYELLLLVLHILATIFFFGCVLLRVTAMAAFRKPAPGRSDIPRPGEDAPIFSVLVALYDEAEMVPDLLAAMDRLEWPRSRLEIKLVCEADDVATLAAIRRHGLPAHVEVVEVPPVEPRTKPKALAYALPLCAGEYVALYDAEDQPHPMQLAEAWQRFRAGGLDLAVVQAPLEISNKGSGPIALMFGFEYAGLFRGLLPWLAGLRVMLPLGGTSNHFRRSALDEVGGWDPFNVTEDADLGLRLARFGYRAETISSPTYEAAPQLFSVWLPQRSRWLKGWAHTWLVHMREPMGLLRQAGPASFLVAQVLFAGMLISVVMHPILLVTLLWSMFHILQDSPDSPLRSFLLTVDIINIVGGYLSFLLLGWQASSPRERSDFWKVVLLTPVYWVMMSWAGWRAIWKLWRLPHQWEKTHNERAAARQFADGQPAQASI